LFLFISAYRARIDEPYVFVIRKRIATLEAPARIQLVQGAAFWAFSSHNFLYAKAALFASFHLAAAFRLAFGACKIIQGFFWSEEA